MIWQKYVGVSSVVVMVVLLIMFIAIYNNRKTDCSQYKKMEIQALIRQAARWAVASQQDNSPMISLLHANYAAGYLQALELIATETEINNFTNLQMLRMKIYGTQDKAAKKVFTTCPQYIGENVDKELVLIGINVKNDTTPN